MNGIPTDFIEGSRTDCHCKVKVLLPVTLHWLDARHGRSSEKRSSPLISAGVQSSEGLCYIHRLLCILMASALYRPTRMRICANLPQRFAVSAADSRRIAKADALNGPRSVSVQGLPLSFRTDARQGWASFSAVTVSSQKMFRELHIFCCSPCWFVPSQPPTGGAMNVWAGLCF